MRAYKFSVSHAITTEFPEHAWEPWKFTLTPKRWWSELGYNLAHGDPVAQTVVQLYIEHVSAQPLSDFEKRRLALLLGNHDSYSVLQNGSLIAAPEKFGQAPLRMADWRCIDKRKQYLLYLRDTFLGGTMEGLYKLSSSLLLATGGSDTPVIHFTLLLFTCYNNQFRSTLAEIVQRFYYQNTVRYFP